MNDKEKEKLNLQIIINNHYQLFMDAKKKEMPEQMVTQAECLQFASWMYERRFEEVYKPCGVDDTQPIYVGGNEIEYEPSYICRQ